MAHSGKSEGGGTKTGISPFAIIAARLNAATSVLKSKMKKAVSSAEAAVGIGMLAAPFWIQSNDVLNPGDAVEIPEVTAI